ncbi:hypothetical protein [Blastopirellula marina]|uniref:Uncharacterized protein n=1 Tax=Blastopirellula marina TaxID=124 RepID=A0A2S8GRC8_9BACT|nr:hypothetical protein [Blastopirellula marina]PQO46952.1 hypothetical protein C5Y93_07320 [Blastopirellula marina]
MSDPELWEEDSAPPPPAYEDSSVPRSRFSLARLVAATAIAALPLLLVTEKNQPYGWVFLVCSLGLGAIAVVVRAADLPRLNLTLLFAIPCMAFCSCCILVVHPAFVLLLGLSSAYALACLAFPIERPELPTESVTMFVWLTGLPTFVLFTLAAIGLTYGRRMPPEQLPDRYWAVLLLPAIFFLLAVVNFYWFVTDPYDSLDENPQRGYWYEMSLVILPYVTLFIIGRVILA